MLQPIIGVFFACLLLLFDQDLSKNCEIDDKDSLLKKPLRVKERT